MELHSLIHYKSLTLNSDQAILHASMLPWYQAFHQTAKWLQLIGEDLEQICDNDIHSQFLHLLATEQDLLSNI